MKSMIEQMCIGCRSFTATVKNKQMSQISRTKLNYFEKSGASEKVRIFSDQSCTQELN